MAAEDVSEALTGDSAAPSYAVVVPMSVCRNLAQLGEFVHDIV